MHDRSKIDEIYEAVLPAMAEDGIEDTLENRHAFLSGLRDAWMEDEHKSLEKTLYMFAINCEITLLSVRINLRK